MMSSPLAPERRCRHCGVTYVSCDAPRGRACCEHCNHYAADLSALDIALGPDAHRAWIPVAVFALAFILAAVISFVAHG